MYIIKENPEDFIVEEIFPLPQGTQGDYSYWKLRKVNLTTLDALSRMAAKLRVPLKYIKFAGNKDRHAITSQTISVYKVGREQVDGLRLPGLELEFLGFFHEPVHLGQHLGNRFVVTVRNIESTPFLENRIPNHFGTQRFSQSNALVGHAIIKKDFQGAVEILRNERVEDYQNAHPRDFVGALRALPKPLLKLYIHSYQSYLWNMSAQAFLEQSPMSENIKIPIVGFGTTFGLDLVSAVVQEILAKEGITQRDFIVRALPDCSSDGGERDLFMTVKDLIIGRLEDDETHPGRKKCVLRFELPKGSYATVLIDFLFGKI